jgi:hypothetical protein
MGTEIEALDERVRPIDVRDGAEPLAQGRRADRARAAGQHPVFGRHTGGFIRDGVLVNSDRSIKSPPT